MVSFEKFHGHIFEDNYLLRMCVYTVTDISFKELNFKGFKENSENILLQKFPNS